MTDEVETARGVKQGAPSSCSLFNAVMDLVTSSIRADMGAKVARSKGKSSPIRRRHCASR